MSSFCANILSPKKIQRGALIIENMRKALSFEKALSKMMVKLTPA